MQKQNKRVLIIGKRGGILHWPEQLLKASCEHKDIEAVIFAINHHNGLDRLLKGALRLVSTAKIQQLGASQLRLIFEKFQPQYVVLTDLVKPNPYMREVLVEFKPSFQGSQWIGDVFPEEINDNNGFVDRFYCTDTGLLQLAESRGLNSPGYLPLAVDAELFGRYQKPWQRRKDGLLFVGAFSQNRQQVLSAIKQPLTVYGRGWKNQLPARHKVNNRNVSLKQLARLYGEHKYVLNIINSDNISKGLNMRCFEVTAAGALLITDEVADLVRNFVVGEEVITWQSIKGKTLIDIPTKKSAEKIARNGNLRCLQHHLYKQRMVHILNDVNA